MAKRLMTSVAVVWGLLTLCSCAERRYAAQTVPPVVLRRVTPAGTDTGTEVRDFGRESQAQASLPDAINLEQQGRLPDALDKYLAVAAPLEQARRGWDQITYVYSRPPEGYLTLVKCHSGAARVLLMLGNHQSEAQEHINEAKNLLSVLTDIAIARQNFAPSARARGDIFPSWTWEIYYQAGNLSLLENRPDAALASYRETARLNPQFEQSLRQYLAQTPPNRVAQSTALSERSSAAPPGDLNRPTGRANQVSTGTTLQIAGVAWGLVAEIFEIELVAPIATAAVLTGMIMDAKKSH